MSGGDPSGHTSDRLLALVDTMRQIQVKRGEVGLMMLCLWSPPSLKMLYVCIQVSHGFQCFPSTVGLLNLCPCGLQPLPGLLPVSRRAPRLCADKTARRLLWSARQGKNTITLQKQGLWAPRTKWKRAEPQETVNQLKINQKKDPKDREIDVFKNKKLTTIWSSEAEETLLSSK